MAGRLPTAVVVIGVDSVKHGAAVCSPEQSFDAEETKPLVASAADASVRSTMQRVHMNILPIFFAMAVCCYIDRTNLAFASLQLNQDLQFTPAVYGLGSGLFFVGYSLAMIPSQLLLVHVGPTLWLGIIVSTWGVTAMLMAGMANANQFYVMRFLLGVAESGAFPGMWSYLNTWYPPEMVTFPYSVIEAAVGVANVIAAPLAAGLLLLDGAGGLAGWQWLFLVEGLPSVGVGLLIARGLPKDPTSARWLGAEDKAWLGSALAAARRHAAEAVSMGPRRLLVEAARNPRVWLVATVGLAKNASGNGMLFWAPILVRSIVHGGGAGGLDMAAATVGASSAHSRSSAGVVLLTAIPFVSAAVCAVWIGRRSQAAGERCRHIALPYLLAGITLWLLPSAAAHSPAAGFACLTAVITLLNAPTAVLNSLASAVSHGPSQAVALALYNAYANMGGLVGPWMIGAIVQRTGTYSAAVHALGMVMIAASGCVWWMRHWGL